MGLLATEGVNGFSMRRLAHELGVSTAAIYHHFATRDDLFFAVLSARAEELTRPQLPREPHERLVAMMVYLIDTLDELPWVVDILVTGKTYGRSAMWILDEFVRAAEELDVSVDDAVYGYGVVWRFALGELMTRRSMRAIADGDDPGRAHWTDTAAAQPLADEFPAACRALSRWRHVTTTYSTTRAVRNIVDGLVDGRRG